MKNNIQQHLLQGVCIAIYIILYIIILATGSNGSSFNGVLQAVQFLMCLLLVCIEYKEGLIISYILIFFSLVSMVRALLFLRLSGPLPGLCNLLIYALTLTLLAYQLSKREREIVEDFLTGLLNRRGLFRRLSARIENEKPFYVIYLDLENFKGINDNYGHRYGDEVLRRVAGMMKKVLDKGCDLSRISGDEFVLILPDKYDPEATCEKIIRAISEKTSLPVGESTMDCYLSAFVGISRYPSDSTDPQTLIRYADLAMSQVRTTRNTRICHFDKSMESELTRRMELERIIRESLDCNSFYLVYQPQFCISDKSLRGYESLIRLRTAEGEYVSPAEFIPIAERSDLILRIDRFVLRRAMTEFRPILEQTGNNLIISVNISAKNMGDNTFADRLQHLMEELSFPPQCLELEITEYCMVQSLEDTAENLHKLQDLGIHIALDDFGTGYSSLSYLASLPIHLLKVDKSLVDDIETSKTSQEFIQAVISMGHLMNCEVISEGVESLPQLNLLRELGCDLVQGYVWGKPLEYEKAKELALGRAK